jgi:hypothetical protein
MQAALALGDLGTFRGTRKRVADHGYSGYGSGCHCQNNIQVKEYKIQRRDSTLKLSQVYAGEFCAAGNNLETGTKRSRRDRPTQRSLPESTGP